MRLTWVVIPLVLIGIIGISVVFLDLSKSELTLLLIVFLLKLLLTMLLFAKFAFLFKLLYFFASKEMNFDERAVNMLNQTE